MRWPLQRKRAKHSRESRRTPKRASTTGAHRKATTTEEQLRRHNNSNSEAQPLRPRPHLRRVQNLFGHHVGRARMGAKTVVVKNRAEAAALKGNIIVVSDQYTDDALKRAVSTKRRYSVDFWGTPQQQVARGTKVNEYLVPYPYPCGNTMIGFRVEDKAYRADPPPKKKDWYLILGKEPKYFTPAVRRALDAVAKLAGVKLVATVPSDKARGLPPSIENRGLLDAAGYSKLLGEAQVALGLGDPVLGPGALDALEHGCAVVQVKYARPRVEKWVNPRLPWRTQHDFVDAVGAPWVASVQKEYPTPCGALSTPCRANRRGAASPRKYTRTRRFWGASRLVRGAA